MCGVIQSWLLNDVEVRYGSLADMQQVRAMSYSYPQKRTLIVSACASASREDRQ